MFRKIAGYSCKLPSILASFSGKAGINLHCFQYQYSTRFLKRFWTYFPQILLPKCSPRGHPHDTNISKNQTFTETAQSKCFVIGFGPMVARMWNVFKTTLLSSFRLPFKLPLKPSATCQLFLSKYSLNHALTYLSTLPLSITFQAIIWATF